ncbi:MAG: TraB/GumN family protein [Pseudomonadota bacterium]|nr:TraB/GumN family protein [Pseudomonadota bacterium]
MGLSLAAAGGNAWAAQPASGNRLEQKADEILVVGRRSGIPMWRVSSGETTLILVGTIDGVTKATAWDPAPLVAALRMSDRVMFPQMQQVRGSPLAMMGYLAKWRRQASLPQGQTLRDFLLPEQFQRLLLLQKRGIVAKGAEKKHPLHLAFSLRASTKKRVGYGQSPSQYVMGAIRKHKLKLAPIRRSSAKSLATNLFSGSPSRHIPCLIDAMDMAEAGPAALTARSQAWAQRQVPEVLRSPAEDVYHSCFPADLEATSARRAELHAAVKRLLLDPQVTVAVLDLHSLARRGGILDDLAAAGHQARGPAWRP